VIHRAVARMREAGETALQTSDLALS